MAKLRYAIVDWTDAAMHGDESFAVDSPVLGTVRGISVGLLVKDEPDFVTLAMDAWETGDFRHCQSIGRRQINHISIHPVLPRRRKKQ